MPSDKIYAGILPVVPTTFAENQDLDLESQRRARSTAIRVLK